MFTALSHSMALISLRHQFAKLCIQELPLCRNHAKKMDLSPPLVLKKISSLICTIYLHMQKAL